MEKTAVILPHLDIDLFQVFYEIKIKRLVLKREIMIGDYSNALINHPSHERILLSIQISNDSLSYLNLSIRA